MDNKSNLELLKSKRNRWSITALISLVIVPSIMYFIHEWNKRNWDIQNAKKIYITLFIIFIICIIFLFISIYKVFFFMTEVWEEENKLSEVEINKLSTEEYKQVLLESNNVLLTPLLNSAELVQAKLDDRNDKIVILRITWKDEIKTIRKEIPYNKEDFTDYLKKVIE